LANRIPKRNLN